METIRGTIKVIRYKDEKNGFVIASVDLDGSTVSVKGYMDCAQKGLFVKFIGEWTEHPMYGPQFNFKTACIDTPSSVNGLIQYLASGFLPGIGEKKAEDIVDYFGEDVIDILDHEPERLAEVSGIGKKTVGKIIDAYKEQKDLRDTMIKLQGIGISSAYSLKLYKVYNNQTLSILYADPYRTIKDVDGIGFKVADKIASLVGISGDNPMRLSSGILHAADNACKFGDTYITKEKLIKVSEELLEVEPELIERSIYDLVADRKLIRQTIKSETVYYLPYLLHAEENIAESLINIMRYPCEDICGEADVARYEFIHSLTLDQSQKDAIMTALSKPVAIITGGPGTGKTTIISALIDIFSQHGVTFELCAPTGRASKRMSESTGHPAATIHRLLEYGPDDEKGWIFKRNRENPLECGAVIVDEVSMVDTSLMSNLVNALTPGMRLILVGDADQLPSVGAGQVLYDLAESGTFAVSRLTSLHRQSEGSGIAELAQTVNHGDIPSFDLFKGEVSFKNSTDQEESLKEIVKIVCENPDTQVLTPMKIGTLGTISINAELQKHINPPESYKNEVQHGRVVFREQDKVMQIKNDYKIQWKNPKTDESGVGVFNGDTGKIVKVDTEEKKVTVLMDDDKTVVYSFDQLDMLIHSYAITVHRSQGSEFANVVIPLTAGNPAFLTKKLIYTAITRAKSNLSFVGEWRNLIMMVKSKSNSIRKTGLKEKVTEAKSNIQESFAFVDRRKDMESA